MTARRGSLQRSSTCPKQKSYSLTHVLRSHHEVGLPSYPSRLRRVCKGICDKESSGMVGTTPWAGQHCHHPPHATFTAFRHGYVDNSSKNICRTYTRLLQKFCKNLGKIMAKFVAKLSNTHARSRKNCSKFLQNFCKNCQETLQDLFKIPANLARIIQYSCTNYPTCVQNSSKIHVKFCKN